MVNHFWFSHLCGPQQNSDKPSAVSGVSSDCSLLARLKLPSAKKAALCCMAHGQDSFNGMYMIAWIHILVAFSEQVHAEASSLADKVLIVVRRKCNVDAGVSYWWRVAVQ